MLDTFILFRRHQMMSGAKNLSSLTRAASTQRQGTEQKTPFISRELPFPVVHSNGRRPLAGWLLSLAGWSGFVGFMPACLILGLAADDLEGGPALAACVLWIAVLGVVLFYGYPRMARLIARGRRMRARRALELLSREDRAPVVFLRSFEDDDLIDPSYPTTYQIIPGRYESHLVRALGAVGPSVALGKPGEPEPEVGAARLYVEDQHWRGAITYLMKQAAAVVGIVGRSAGLWWEIDLALTEVPPERLLFFFPFPAPKRVRTSYWRASFLQNPLSGRWLRRKMAPEMEAEREKRYQDFRERFEKYCKGPMPACLGNARFLEFSAERIPRLVPPAQRSLLAKLASLDFRARLDVPFSRELRAFVARIQAAQHR